MSKKKPQRSQTLIKSRLQLKLVAIFFGVALMPLMVQTFVINSLLTTAAPLLPQGAGNELMAQVPYMLGRAFMISVCLLVPLTTTVGILATFRLAGPLHRFEQYLNGVARGEQVGPCHIRDGDELHDLCDAINAATEAQRRRRRGTDAPGTEQPVRKSEAA